MSESLTINTLNRGHYTYTHRGQRLEWDQVMRIREGERLKKNWKNPNQGPTRLAERAELAPWTCLQSRLSQCLISLPPEG